MSLCISSIICSIFLPEAEICGNIEDIVNIEEVMQYKLDIIDDKQVQDLMNWISS